jgi:hypothetical protein
MLSFKQQSVSLPFPHIHNVTDITRWTRNALAAPSKPPEITTLICYRIWKLVSTANNIQMAQDLIISLCNHLPDSCRKPSKKLLKALHIEIQFSILPDKAKFVKQDNLSRHSCHAWVMHCIRQVLLKNLRPGLDFQSLHIKVMVYDGIPLW